MIEFLRKLFAPVSHSVDTILADFHQIVARLEAAAEVHAMAADEHAKAAVVSDSLADAARAEYERAKAAIQRIRALIA